MRYDLLRILLVDDNEHMRMLLAAILRGIGVRQIFEAGDGAEGLERLRNHEVDLILTDLAMAPLDGIDFVRLVRNAADRPHTQVPVIMITGHSTLQRVSEARDAGVSEFLAKPVTARGLLERLSQAVNHPRAFVRASEYFGPDRRRRADPAWAGPWRRAVDGAQPSVATYEI